MEIKIKIKEESFFNNGKVILAASGIESDIRDSLNETIFVDEVERKEKGIIRSGIEAGSLNKKIRECLRGHSIDRFETHVEHGVFFHEGIEGFDFSKYDEKYNISRLYNYYCGAVGIMYGNEKILDLYKKLQKNKNDWKEEVNLIENEIGLNQDYIIDKGTHTIVGEIQFGNWGLIYKDLFNLLNADLNPGIDLYIYITSTGNLSNQLSSGTVSYERAFKLIGDSRALIKTPIWLIGLDYEAESIG